MRPLTRVVLAGEGGQGVQAVAEILAEAAYNEGKQALYIPNFGLEQRGGVSVAFIQVGDKRIGAPKFPKGDVVVALSGRAVLRTHQYSGPNTIYVYDSSFKLEHDDLPPEARRILSIPALEKAKELHPRVFNIVVMGAVLGFTDIVSYEAAKEALEKQLGYKFQKDPGLRDLNYRALDAGIELAREASKGEEVRYA
ncbi:MULTISPECIES: 2-oxoacid:acceptor oxidoreductase family protein [Syntrophothermus]|uniref:Pyruvate/ketoisovalerate oxidoreductase n=1 Tax=Syntrophothermus lipocalidus (strain DSM 12680 / TGB-C1) TaxID=643648 RepID=D7CII4_SYNLT|nr:MULTISPECIES: 2-oxoacid:acceptor oxidoreductase family protein [Syntrophothermus]ADI00849.1 Pyruvate/ketoisovalerate oxidoreductase [Syntrophothermus lipocalidus DSM 12680]NSW83503.1 2-oxoacid:acceptor oxidoreductase family protein [Syntrophothermus sp.]